MRAQLLLIFALIAIAFAAKDRVWSQVQATGTAPSPRFDFSYAFNPATNNFLVFGGGAFGGQFFGDFFAYNTNTNKWTTLPSGPAPRTDAAGALCNGLFYVAGGKNKTTTFSDMWHYNEATRVWTEVPSGLRLNSGALACSASSLIYNGGSDEAGVYSTKTYSYNKNTQTWSIVASTVQPSARQWTPLTYSPITSEFVLFGGWLGSSPADDLFVLSDSAKQWTSLTQGAHPTKRSGHAMAYDSSINQILLFGGEHFDGSTGLNDIWFFNPVTRVWTPTTARNAPPKGRLGAAAVYIGNNEYLVFGGVTGWTNFDDIVNDLWKLSSVPSACVVNGAISASNRWTENGETVRQYSASFKNDGTETAYAVDFTLALGAAQIKSSWNIRQYGTSSTFALSNFYSLNPAQTYSGAGFIASGNAAPVLSSVSPVCYRNSASIQATCSSVKVTAILRSGATYLQNGELRSEYDLTITNTGPSSFNSLALTIVPSDGVSSIQSSWNIQQVGTSQSYNVDLFGGPLAAGQTYTNTHGFIWAGPATFQVRCAPSA